MSDEDYRHALDNDQTRSALQKILERYNNPDTLKTAIMESEWLHVDVHVPTDTGLLIIPDVWVVDPYYTPAQRNNAMIIRDPDGGSGGGGDGGGGRGGGDGGGGRGGGGGDALSLPQRSRLRRGQPSSSSLYHSSSGGGNNMGLKGSSLLESTLPNENRIFVMEGDIFKFKGKVIVNATNRGGQGGGGIDGQFVIRGGQQLIKERHNMGEIDWGKCKSTISGDIYNEKHGYRKYVIHAVGPDFDDEELRDLPEAAVLSILGNAYKNTLTEALDLVKDDPDYFKYNGDSGPPLVLDIAFPVISAGHFKGDVDLGVVLRTAYNAIHEWLYNTDSSDQVRVNVYIVIYILTPEMQEAVLSVEQLAIGLGFNQSSNPF